MQGVPHTQVHGLLPCCQVVEHFCPHSLSFHHATAVQVIVNSTNTSTALQSGLVTSIYDGTLAVRLRSNGEGPGGQEWRGSV